MESTPQAKSGWGATTRTLLRTYVWSRKALIGIAIVSPTILGTIWTSTITSSIDRRLSRLTEMRSGAASETIQLDQLVSDVESKELLRTSFLASLKSANADDGLKYALDQLYRNSAQGSLRRIAALLYPDSWKERTAPYDALLASPDKDVKTVQQLSAFENDLIMGALQRNTAKQAASDRLSERIERLSRWKSTAYLALTGLTNVLTILVFLYKTGSDR